MKAFLSACSRFKLSNTFAVYMCDSEENRDMPLVFLASSRVQSAATQPDNAAFPLIMFVGSIGDCSRGSRCYVSVCATIDYDDTFDDDDDDDDYTVNICIYLSVCLSIYVYIHAHHTHMCVYLHRHAVHAHAIWANMHILHSQRVQGTVMGNTCPNHNRNF